MLMCLCTSIIICTTDMDEQDVLRSCLIVQAVYLVFHAVSMSMYYIHV